MDWQVVVAKRRTPQEKQIVIRGGNWIGQVAIVHGYPVGYRYLLQRVYRQQRTKRSPQGTVDSLKMIRRRVAPDLSNITNKDMFDLSKAAQSLLVKNGFVVVPSDYREFLPCMR